MKSVLDVEDDERCTPSQAGTSDVHVLSALWRWIAAEFIVAAAGLFPPTSVKSIITVGSLPADVGEEHHDRRRR